LLGEFHAEDVDLLSKGLRGVCGVVGDVGDCKDDKREIYGLTTLEK